VTKTEIRFFRERLQRLMAHHRGEESELRENVFGAGGDSSPITGQEQRTNDDLSREQADTEVAISLLGTERGLLDECEAALTRIEQGTFGACEKCSKPIAKHRLMALPYARTCVACSRTAER
jgi:DnaK suppressor protein